MPYQSTNPATDEITKAFVNHADAELASALTRDEWGGRSWSH